MLRLEVAFIGEVFHVDWKDDKLTGDFEAAAMLESAGSMMGGITHVGYTLPGNPLGDYESVIVLAMMIFDELVYSNRTLEYEEGTDY